MFCKLCGKEIPEGMEKCPACFPEVEEVKANASETAPEAAPVEAAPEVVAPAEENEAATEGFVVDTEQAENFEEPSFEEEPKKAKGKKSKKGLIIGGAIAAVVVAAAVFVAFNFTFFKGLFIKTFGSDEDYFAFVEKTAMSQYVDTATSSYGDALDNIISGSYGVESKVELNISDAAIDLLKEALPAEYKDLDLNNFKNFSFAINYLVDDTKQAADLKFNVGDKSLIDVNAILDAEGKDAYLALPGLTSKYIKFEDVLATATEGAVNMEMLEQVDASKIAEALPSEKVLNDILNRYIEIAFDSFDKVNKGSETVTVGSYSQKLTTLEVKVTEKDCLKAVKAMLNELKDDKDVKNLINDIEEFIVAEYGDLLGEVGYTEGTLYSTFKSYVSLASMGLTSAEASTEELFSIIDYVNGKHEIVGRSIEVEGEVAAYYVTVQEGKNMAFEANVPSIEFQVYGEGTKKGDVVTADYSVSVEGQKYIEFSLEDFDFDSARDGMLNGSVTIAPSAEILSELVGANDTAISLLSPAIKFTFQNSDSESYAKVALLSNKTEYISFAVSSKLYDADSIKLPTDVIDSNNVSDWLNTIDLNKVVDAIKDLGAPKEVLSELEKAVDEIEKAGGLGSFVEEYAAQLEDYYGSYGESVNEDDYYDSDYDYDYDYDYNYDEEYIYDDYFSSSDGSLSFDSEAYDDLWAELEDSVSLYNY